VRLAAALGALAVGAGAGAITVTTPPRPPFPGPAGDVPPAKRLVVVSSRHVAPGGVSEWVGVATVPQRFHGLQLVKQVGPLGFYGSAGDTRLLLAPGRYTFDFKNYVWPPGIRPGEREFVYEEVVWAREADGVLYVENAHWTYARSSYGLNGYVTAFDLKTGKRLWRSRALVANARTFVLAGDYLVTSYGFSAEPDYLYLLDRSSGRIVERLLLPSMPMRIIRRGDRLSVRTYDHDLVVEVRSA
jgi:hypothetical protein